MFIDVRGQEESCEALLLPTTGCSGCPVVIV